MSNPVFSNSDVFGEPRRTGAPQGARGGTATAPNPYSQYGTAGQAPMGADQLGAMYDAPSATPADTKRLTYDDVIIKTGGLLALLVVVAAATFMLAPGLVWVGLIGGLVLGLVNAFKKNPSPFLITAYAVFQGMFVGGISFVFNGYEGIVFQAIIGTVSVFAGSLFLFKTGKIQVTPKFTRFLMMALIGYALFSLINLVLVWTDALGGFGMRNGWLGIAVGAFAIVLGIMSLMVDFDFIKRGVEEGIPAKFAWTAAFGLIVTLVWLYTEILRLLAIINIFSGD
ncbi:Bax inhibitor-1/YccA family protein [Myceligenerans xiligouense]|uniref:Putative YccA/Bax inhibitor family protein n=1 Tax=Myceligenerans xiligouense TaxID=253184 RepID=A0A3N4YGU4_9MICO|nr:Bax inhibitor-1/YccA family protein [Myceligenerans xiligouense]RPF20033.1 putative YccA/Bax inhibitor family protein [Myceligenerans xiligouense]